MLPKEAKYFEGEAGFLLSSLDEEVEWGIKPVLLVV